MGLFDTLLGRKKLPRSATDLVGEIAQAAVTIETQLGHTPTGEAAIAVRPLEGSAFTRAEKTLQGILDAAASSMGSTVKLSKDSQGFLWATVSDNDFTDCVAATQIAAQTLLEEGFGDQILCAVFPFEAPSQGFELIYSYRRGSWWCAATRPGHTRDTALELRVHAILHGEIKLEQALESRFPVWDLPWR